MNAQNPSPPTLSEWKQKKFADASTIAWRNISASPLRVNVMIYMTEEQDIDALVTQVIETASRLA